MSLQWDDLVAHSANLREWLVALQPTDEARANWWLGVVLIATEEVQSSIVREEVPDQTTLEVAVHAINVASEEGPVTVENRAVRLANLAGLLAKAGCSSHVPPELFPDIAARRCLDLILIAPAYLGDAKTDWRSLPVEELRKLRAAKNLVSPVQRLEPYLQDRDLAIEAAKWRTLYPHLP